MTGGWRGEPARHALAAKGVRTSIHSNRNIGIQKAFIMSHKELEQLRHIKVEVNILERQLDKRKEMLNRLEHVYILSKSSGDVELERRAAMLKDEMLTDIERHIDKILDDLHIIEHRYGDKPLFDRIRDDVSELAMYHNALVMRYE